MEPIEHGPFRVEADGALCPLRPPALRFDWRGRPVHAAWEESALRLSTQAGRVPFTAEARAHRPHAFAMLRGLPADLPAGWRLRLMPDHGVRLEAALPLPDRPTATAIMEAMVRFALALDPYLDRLESAGVGDAGREKTWPG